MNAPSADPMSSSAEGRSSRGLSSEAVSSESRSAASGTGQVVALVLSWTAVGLPLAWGVLETLRKALALFQ